MQVIYDILERSVGLEKPAVSLGTFDGLHLGHLAILNHLSEVGRREGRNTVAVTYHPHPQRVLAGDDRGPKLLSTLEERLSRFEQLGLGTVVVVPFDRAFSRWTADRFIAEVLVGRLDVGHLIVGYDHAFGHDRRGKSDLLEAQLAKHGVPVEVVPPVKSGGGPIKSSRIRRLLNRGELEEANRLLGYEYSFTGQVVHGDRRGAELGFPTANVRVPDEKQLPANALYGARAALGSETHPALVHIGPRPTVGQTAVSVEVHLLDFPSRDLYGEELTVTPEVELRKVETFASVRALTEQMEKDRAQFIAYRRQRKENTRAS
jgi:riboflavin kinase/FMN adenylyltransferase